MVSSMLGKGLMRAVWILQALGAIAVGLLFFKIDVFASMAVLMGGKLAMLVRPVQLLLGLCGVAGLLELLAGCGSCCE